MKFWPLCLLNFSLILAGCVSVPKTVFYQMNDVGDVGQKTLGRFLWESPLEATKNSSETLILNHDLASYYLLQIRGTQERHRHDYHDLVLSVQSGTGILFLGEKSIRVKSGSVIFVAHGTPHYFLNSGTEPAVIMVSYAPFYSGEDFVPMPSAPKKKK